MPGILLIFSKAFNKKPLTEFLVYVTGLSLSFFVVMPWFIRYFNSPLMISSYSVFIVSAVIMVINIRKIDMKHLTMDKAEIVLICIFLLVLLLRCLPMFFQLAPAGADMSIYSNVARLIYENDGISYSNKMPIAGPVAHSIGFAALSAEISLLGDIPVYRSALLLSCIGYAMVCFGLYVLLLRFFNRPTSAATSIAATFLSCSPWWLIRLGGDPAVLSLFFFLIAISLIIELKSSFSWSKLVFAFLSLAAALTAYSAVYYSSRAYLLLLIPLAFISAEAISSMINTKKKYLLSASILIGFVLYCVFYLFSSISMCSVTQADIDALRWMDNTISKSAVIANNYGDAGLWIPAITGRAITNPYSEPVHGEELAAGLAKLRPDYIFIGGKAVYQTEYKKDDLAAKPWRYKRVYSNDGAQVWKIL